jgi:peptidoglycan/LPS O-acetylase OafA/YrhL
LRAVSIVAVVWHHAAGYRQGILGRGFLGVELFFAISGFLITTLLLRERERTGTISLPSFYVRRTLRIFPLYYAVLALYVGLVALTAATTPAGAQFFANLPAFATYTSNWFVDLHGERVIFYYAWSLATEEQFYAVWPPVMRLARRSASAAIFIASLLVVGEGSRWAVRSGILPSASLAVRIAGSIATPICLGCLAAILLHSADGFRWAYRLAGRKWSSAVAASLLAVTIALDGTPTVLLGAAMTFLVVCCVIRRDHALRALLDHPAVKYVGTISYGTYLLHMFAINAVRRVVPGGLSPIVTFAAGLPLALLMATISYRYFEQPFLRLKQRFAGAAVERVRAPLPDSAPRST